MGSTETHRDRRGHAGVVAGFAAGVAAVLMVGGALWLFVGSGTNRFGAPAGTDEVRQGLVLSAQERRGEEIYNANCVTCHGGPTGGSMMDYPPRHNANGHTWHHADCQLEQIVREGADEMTDMMRQMMAPPDAPRMQAFKDRLSGDEIDAVLAYIKTMWTPEERTVQAQVTREECRVVRQVSDP